MPIDLNVYCDILIYKKGGETMSEKEIKSLVLRLPKDLYEKVKETAEASRLSVTQFIINALAEVKEVPTIEQRIQAIERRLDEIEKNQKRKK